jgi:hypothetical protein
MTATAALGAFMGVDISVRGMCCQPQRCELMLPQQLKLASKSNGLCLD